MALPRLKKRIDFLRVSQVKCFTKTPTVLVQCGYSADTEDQIENLRVGFTASRRVGNAVKRNRAKRRLRAIADRHLKTFVSQSQTNFTEKKLDFVFIAVSSTGEANFQDLYRDCEKGTMRCLKQLHQKNCKKQRQEEK